MKSHGMTIQMKATEQYFPVVLLITLYKFVQRKATEQNYPVGHIFRCKRWFSLTFESLDKILCGHSNESLRAVLSHGAVYYTCTLQGGSNF